MDISSLTVVNADYYNEVVTRHVSANQKAEESFGSILESAMGMINETNELRNVADAEQIRFALGEAENTHDLLIAQTKALTALQYTVAVKDKALEAYKEIMNMQI